MNQELPTNPPIRHLVYLAIKPENNNAEVIKDGLASLSKRLPGVRAFYFEPCETTPPYTHSFFIDFENERARDAYLNNECHAELAKEVIIPRLKGDVKSAVLVFDYDKKLKAPAAVSQIVYNHSDVTAAHFLFKSNVVKDSKELLRELEAMPEVKATKLKLNQSREGLSQDYDSLVKIKLRSPFPTKSVPAKPSLLFFTSRYQKKDVSETTQQSDVSNSPRSGAHA